MGPHGFPVIQIGSLNVFPSTHLYFQCSHKILEWKVKLTSMVVLVVRDSFVQYNESLGEQTQLNHYRKQKRMWVFAGTQTPASPVVLVELF